MPNYDIGLQEKVRELMSEIAGIRARIVKIKKERSGMSWGKKMEEQCRVRLEEIKTELVNFKSKGQKTLEPDA
jgi:hypothetical protein